MKKEFPNGKTLIIFTGGPGTGKSETTKRFLEYLDNEQIELISYDKIKEKNWDIFGFDNEEQKYRLNEWGLEEFYLTLQKKMWEEKTILIEYPFYQKHRNEIQRLVNDNFYHAVTVLLYADMQTVYQRSVVRNTMEDRHPGHFLNCYHKETYIPSMLNHMDIDKKDYETFVREIAHKEYNIKVGNTIPLDVNDFNELNYEKLYQEILLAFNSSK